MTKNIYLRALIVFAVSFVLIQALALMIRQIYYVINDLDSWALDMLNSPSKAVVFAIIIGIVYLAGAKVAKKDI